MTKEYKGGMEDPGTGKGNDGFNKVQSHKATFNNGQGTVQQVGRKTDMAAPSRDNKG